MPNKLQTKVISIANSSLLSILYGLNVRVESFKISSIMLDCKEMNDIILCLYRWFSFVYIFVKIHYWTETTIKAIEVSHRDKIFRVFKSQKFSMMVIITFQLTIQSFKLKHVSDLILLLVVRKIVRSSKNILSRQYLDFFWLLCLQKFSEVLCKNVSPVIRIYRPIKSLFWWIRYFENLKVVNN